MLYVTHDQIEAMTLANRIGVLDNGCLVQLGSPQQVYEDPVSVNVASRLGSPRINLILREVFPNLAVPDQVKTLGVRAEHIKLHRHFQPDVHASKCQIKRIERLSDQYLVHLRIEGSAHDLIAAANPGEAFETGDVVGVELIKSLWFDAQGQRIRPSLSTLGN